MTGRASLLAHGAAMLLAAYATIAFVEGCRHAWLLDGDVDMQTRFSEYALFRDGIYPDPALEPTPPPYRARMSVYPPYALPLFAPFFEPGGRIQGRVLVEVLSVVSLGLMGAWAWRRFRDRGVAVAALAAVAAAAVARGNAVAMGQFSIVCMGLVALQMGLLDRGRPAAAGVCWALAMIKPQIAIAFAPLFLVGGAATGLVIGLTVLLALSLGACAWTEISPFAVCEHWFLTSNLAFNGHGAITQWMARSTGLSMRHLVGAGLALVVAAGWSIRRWSSASGDFDRLWIAATLPVLCMLTFYHRSYDNIMLWPLLLATLERALTRKTPVDGLITALTALSLIVPERIIAQVPFIDLVRMVVWIVAAVTVVPRRRLVSSASSRA